MHGSTPRSKLILRLGATWCPGQVTEAIKCIERHAGKHTASGIQRSVLAMEAMSGLLQWRGRRESGRD